MSVWGSSGYTKVIKYPPGLIKEVICWPHSIRREGGMATKNLQGDN